MAKHLDPVTYWILGTSIDTACTVVKKVVQECNKYVVKMPFTGVPEVKFPIYLTLLLLWVGLNVVNSWRIPWNWEKQDEIGPKWL